MKLTVIHLFYMVIFIGVAMALITIIDEFIFPLGNMGQWAMDLLTALLSVPLILNIRLSKKEREKIGACGTAEYDKSWKKEIIALVVFLEVFGWVFLLTFMHVFGLI